MALVGPARVDVIGWLLALVLPVVLWHGTVAEIATGFRFEAAYLTGWAPWLLMLAGLACFVPVLRRQARADRERFHGSPVGAWFGWSVTLYLLGFLLAFQVARITDGLTAL